MPKTFIKILFAMLLAVRIAPVGAAAESTRLYLSGQDSSAGVEWEFMCSAGLRAQTWSKISVPSNWEMQGFGSLSYGSVEPSETGRYRHRFTVPSTARGQRIFLVFDGVMTDATVRLNGRSTGEKHQGGFYRFRHEVTSLIKFDDQNLLEVDVDETSSNAGVNRAERTGDYWNFGGIYRPVWLEIVPAQFIERMAVNARADGFIALHATLAGSGDGTTLQARVLDTTGREFSQSYPVIHDGTVGVVEWKVEGVHSWSAENPVLYSVQLDLLDQHGAVLHRKVSKVGFRTFEMRPGEGLFLNGRQIVLQGANRHSFSAVSGRALSEADHREDIALAKEMNMNALRMSHYPPDERFLELCDELGLYILDELAGWQKAYDTTVGLRLVEEMVVRDVNHPSILFWDNGNEGGWNTELDPEFARRDPQNRPVLHPWEAYSGINTAHYKRFVQSEWLAKGYTTSWTLEPGETPKMGEYPLIYLPTEFLHGLFDGGAGAGLEDYWTMMRSNPTFGGGFLWSFRDEGVIRPDTGEIDVRGNSAPDGIVGPRGEREASFYTIKELWTPLALSGQPPGEGNTLKLDVENRYAFTNAKDCRYGWSLEKLPLNQTANRDPISMLATGEGNFPSIEPAARGVLSIALPSNWRTADVLSLRVTDGKGAELWTYTWPLPGVDRLRGLPSQSTTARSQISTTESPAHFEVKAGRVQVRFDRSTGMLASINQGDRSLSLSNGPRPASGNAQLVSMKIHMEGEEAVVSSKFAGALDSIEWRVRANGWIDCAYVYRPVLGVSYQGVCFDYPADRVRAKSWVGEGPYRVWQNRRPGVSFGQWSNAYNDSITGWSGWSYPEFKGCFASVRWLSLDTTEGTLEVVTHSDDQFVQVLTPQFPPGDIARTARVDLPEAGLALLDVIPPIGTKFSTPDTMGPQGQLPRLPDQYTRRISLLFSP